MSDARLRRELCAALSPHVPTIRPIEAGFEAELDIAYGRLSLIFDHDADNSSMRLYVLLPPPAGAGPAFFGWCLSMNTLYWDVKIGMDAEGMLLVMADVDLAPLDAQSACRTLLVRIAALCELIDDDLIAHLLEHDLATPSQRARWSGDRNVPA